MFPRVGFWLSPKKKRRVFAKIDLLGEGKEWLNLLTIFKNKKKVG